jgi:hypothetical protein
MNLMKREHLTSFHLSFKTVHQQLQGANYFQTPATLIASTVATASQKVGKLYGPVGFHH